MIERASSLAIGWNGRRIQADWDYIESPVNEYGASRIHTAPRVSFVHN